jgi:hypothetical protein
MTLRAIWVGAAGAVILLWPATPAGAAAPEFPHGVGVCMSQVAIQPELAEVARLGELVQTAAGPGTEASDVPSLLDDLRGDGPGGCGAPPGPGHLQ